MPVTRRALAPTGGVTRVPSSLRALVQTYRAQDDPLAWALRRIPGGFKAVINLLRLSDDAQAQLVITGYERVKRGKLDAYPGVHAVIDEIGMSPRDFVGLVSRVAFDFNVAIGNTIAAFEYPKMMKRSMQRAQQISGTEERKLHFQHTGYVPSGKGIQIGIRNTVTAAAEDDAPLVPGKPASFDRTARQVVRDLPAVRQEEVDGADTETDGHEGA